MLKAKKVIEIIITKIVIYQTNNKPLQPLKSWHQVQK